MARRNTLMAITNVDEISDAELVEIATAELASEIQHRVLARAWSVSPHVTLLAISRALARLALEYVAAHPEHRAAVLMNLRSLASCVEVESGCGKPQ
jgi:hypothetical protein